MPVRFNVEVSLPSKTYFALKKVGALTGAEIGDVIAKFVDYWQDSNGEEAEQESPLGMSSLVQLWRSPRGEMFPVGLKLRAQYVGKTYNAKVTNQGIEFDGKKYDSPSAAAIAVKETAGKVGAGANTNGWQFWEMWDAKVMTWVSIQGLKDGNKK